MGKITIKPNRFTIIYYELRDNLKLNLEPYIMLNTMRHYSKRNTYTNGISFLSEYSGLAPNTVRKYLLELVHLGFITKEVMIHEQEKEEYCKRYFLHPDITTEFESYEGSAKKYLIVFHRLSDLFGLNINEASLLYLFYSYSKNVLKKATACCREYLQYLKFSEQTFYNCKRKLYNLGLIEVEENNGVVVTVKATGIICAKNLV